MSNQKPPPIPALPLDDFRLGTLRQPRALTVIGLVSLTLSLMSIGAIVYLSDYGIDQARVLYERANAPVMVDSPPPRPMPDPTLPPMSVERLGRAGLPRAERWQIIEYVKQTSGVAFNTDKQLMLDWLLAEVGRDFTHGTPPTSSFDVSSIQVVPLASEPRQNSPAFDGSGEWTVTLTNSNGEVAVTRHTATLRYPRTSSKSRIPVSLSRCYFSDPGVGGMTPAKLIEAEIVSLSQRSPLTERQAAALYDFGRRRLPNGQTLTDQYGPAFDPISFQPNGVVRIDLRYYGHVAWIFPNGALVEFRARDEEHYDPNTGLRTDVMLAKIEPPLITKLKGPVAAYYVYAHVGVAWAAFLFLASCALLVNAPGCRAAMHLWVMGQFVMVAIGLGLSFYIGSAIATAVAPASGRPASGLAFPTAMGVCASLFFGLLLPGSILVILNSDNVVDFHRAVRAHRRDDENWWSLNGDRRGALIALGAGLALTVVAAAHIVLWLFDDRSDTLRRGMGIALCVLVASAFFRISRRARSAASIAMALAVLAPLALYGPEAAAQVDPGAQAIILTPDAPIEAKRAALMTLRQSNDGRRWVIQAARDEQSPANQRLVLAIIASEGLGYPDGAGVRTPLPLQAELDLTVAAIEQLAFSPDNDPNADNAMKTIVHLTPAGGHYTRIVQQLGKAETYWLARRCGSALSQNATYRADVRKALSDVLKSEPKLVARVEAQRLLTGWDWSVVSEDLHSSDRDRRIAAILAAVDRRVSETAHADRVHPRLLEIATNDADLQSAGLALLALRRQSPSGPQYRELLTKYGRISGSGLLRPQLLHLLNPDAVIRQAAIADLCKGYEYAHSWPIAQFLVMFETDPDPDVRNAIVAHLGKSEWVTRTDLGLAMTARARVAAGRQPPVPHIDAFASWPKMPALVTTASPAAPDELSESASPPDLRYPLEQPEFWLWAVTVLIPVVGFILIQRRSLLSQRPRRKQAATSPHGTEHY